MNAFVRAGFVCAVALLGAVGCSTNQQVQTPRYVLQVPDYWPIKQRSKGDGDPTKVVIQNFGTPIDEGVGNTAGSNVNYDARTADVDVRLYTWQDLGGTANPSQEVYDRLRGEAELELGTHFVILDLPVPECNRFPRKYKVDNIEMTPIDLVRRPGWRVIVNGARKNGALLGVIARVEWQGADMARNCHNLRNMQVMLQNLLDGFTFLSGPAAATPAAPAGPAAPAAPAAPPPTEGPPPAEQAPADQAATQPQ